MRRYRRGQEKREGVYKSWTLLCNVVDEEGSSCAAIVRPCNASESFLSRCIPQLPSISNDMYQHKTQTGRIKANVSPSTAHQRDQRGGEYLQLHSFPTCSCSHFYDFISEFDADSMTCQTLPFVS